MSGLNADPPDLDRLARTLTDSLTKLKQVAGEPASDIDAGESTPAVAKAMATFYETLSKMAADTEQAATEVHNSGGVYTRTDEQAAADLPPLSLPTDGTSGGR